MLVHFSHVQLFATLGTARLLCLWDSPGKNTGVGSHFLLHGSFWNQGLNPYLLYFLYWPPGKALPSTLGFNFIHIKSVSF